MTDTPKFTLRFHKQRTHDLLGVVAEQLGISKNRLAEEMLERELEAAALLVEHDLDDTLRKLREYPSEKLLTDDVEAFAEAEAFGEDPLRARLAEQPAAIVDADVLEAFRA